MIINTFTPKLSNSNNFFRGFKGTTTGGRNLAKVVPGKAEHSFTMEGKIFQWDILEYLLGSKSGSGTVTYTEANGTISSTIHRCIVNSGTSATDQDMVWTGSVLNQVSIKCTVGEPITITADWMAAKRKYDTTVVATAALPSVDVYNFSGVAIEYPGGTPLTNIAESAEITITNNYEMLYGLGSRLATSAKPKGRDYKIKLSLKYLDNTNILAAIGSATPTGTTNPTENASVKFTFTRGSSSLVLTFNTFTLDDHTGKEEVAEVIGEDLSGTAVSCTAVEIQ